MEILKLAKPNFVETQQGDISFLESELIAKVQNFNEKYTEEIHSDVPLKNNHLVTAFLDPRPRQKEATTLKDLIDQQCFSRNEILIDSDNESVDLVEDFIAHQKVCKITNLVPLRREVAIQHAEMARSKSYVAIEESYTNNTELDDSKENAIPVNCNRGRKKQKLNKFDQGAYNSIDQDKLDAAIFEYLQNNNIPDEDLKYFANRSIDVYRKYTDNDIQSFLDSIIEKAGVNRNAKQIKSYIKFRHSGKIGICDMPWTEEEDKKLLELKKGNYTWVEISDTMNRKSPDHRYKILENLKNTEETATIHVWNELEIKDFVKAIRVQHALITFQNIYTLRINWQIVANCVKTKNSIECKVKW